MSSPVSSGKTNRKSAGGTREHSSAGKNAAAIAPPAYGIDFVDAGMPAPAQFQPDPAPHSNHTGLPDALKSGIESLSGRSLEGVKVHFNSSRPAQLNARAYTQGSDIHVAPGQERHLPHEAWHVVQQAQGRVRPTMQMKGVGINDEEGLEREADVMGAKAAVQRMPGSLASGPVDVGGAARSSPHRSKPSTAASEAAQRKSDRALATLCALAGKPVPPGRPVSGAPVQRLIGIEGELSVPVSVAGPGADGTARVTEFLGGGVQEGTHFTPAANGYHKEADHDDVSRECATALTQANQFGAGIAVPPFRVANMEYVSQPYDDETGPGRAAFQACVTHMAQDMVATANAARTGLAPVGPAHRVGVPPVADWNHFCNTHAIPLGFGTGARNAIIGYISNSPDVQITMGIRLEKISTFLRSAENHAVLRPAAMHNPNRLLTDDVVTTAQAVLLGCPGLTLGQRTSPALKGYLSLIIQYLYGNFSYRGGNATVGKNMVTFLSKYPLDQVQREMDNTIRPDNMAPLLRTALGNLIQTLVWTRVNQPDVINLWNAPLLGQQNGGPLGNWRTWLTDVLDGNQDAFSIAQITPARYIDPSDHVNSTVIANPGANVRAAVGGVHHSGVIPLEARHIGRILPIMLWGIVNSVMTHVRNTNA